MSRCRIIAGCVILCVAGLGLAAWAVVIRPPRLTSDLNAAIISRQPVISPDYSGLVIPPNIAPLNFVVKEPGTAYRIVIRDKAGPRIELASRNPRFDIPVTRWLALLEANKGDRIEIDVSVLDAGGQWRQFKPIVNTVAREPIDAYLVYRYMDPVYRCWGNISIQQRDLSGFAESCLLSNRSIEYDCINCHSFTRDHDDRMALQLRSQNLGPRLLLTRGDRGSAVNTATTANPVPSSYLAWHPNGHIIAFASIKVTQFFHAKGETRDVFDKASDVSLYHVETNRVTTAPALSRPDRLETYPTWSPDGKWLYFCSAAQLGMERFQEVKYDLVRIAYDADTDGWGEPETIVKAADLNGSVTHPRISPDGRWLMFCRCDYGNFSIYHPESDLYLMDLAGGEYRRMEINSDRADSYHSWSGNSKWVVFSSKRRDGLLTHPYLTHIDDAGQASKPFILPQQDPTFYEKSLKVFNVPELIAAPADALAAGLMSAISRPVSVSDGVKD